MTEQQRDPAREALERIAQENGLTPEQMDALLERAKAVIEQVEQIINEVWARIVDTLAEYAKYIDHFISHAIDAMLSGANDHPKWWHLYKHAKKARTRKKYRRRLVQQLIGKLQAAAMT